MSNDVRHLIVGNIKTALANINGGSYSTTIGSNVIEFRDFQNEPMTFSQVPAVNVADTDSTITRLNNGIDEHLLTVEITGLAEKQSDNPHYARQILADIQIALGADRRRGGYAVDTFAASTRTSVLIQGVVCIAATLVVRVKYWTKAFSPLTQI